MILNCKVKNVNFSTVLYKTLATYLLAFMVVYFFLYFIPTSYYFIPSKYYFVVILVCAFISLCYYQYLTKLLNEWEKDSFY